MATYDLHPGVEVAHLALDVDEWEAVYVVGDVHGCLRPLEALLSELAVAEDDLVVFVGDLLRKGPDSAAVLDLVRRRENLVSVRGDNEEKVIRGEATLPGLDDGDVTSFGCSTPSPATTATAPTGSCSSPPKPSESGSTS